MAQRLKIISSHEEERAKCKTQQEREELLRRLVPPKVIKKFVKVD